MRTTARAWCALILFFVGLRSFAAERPLVTISEPAAQPSSCGTFIATPEVVQTLASQLHLRPDLLERFRTERPPFWIRAVYLGQLARYLDTPGALALLDRLAFHYSGAAARAGAAPLLGREYTMPTEDQFLGQLVDGLAPEIQTFLVFLLRGRLPAPTPFSMVWAKPVQLSVDTLASLIAKYMPTQPRQLRRVANAQMRLPGGLLTSRARFPGVAARALVGGLQRRLDYDVRQFHGMVVMVSDFEAKMLPDLVADYPLLGEAGCRALLRLLWGYSASQLPYQGVQLRSQVRFALAEEVRSLRETFHHDIAQQERALREAEKQKAAPVVSGPPGRGPKPGTREERIREHEELVAARAAEAATDEEEEEEEGEEGEEPTVDSTGDALAENVDTADYSVVENDGGPTLSELLVSHALDASTQKQLQRIADNRLKGNEREFLRRILRRIVDGESMFTLGNAVEYLNDFEVWSVRILRGRSIFRLYFKLHDERPYWLLLRSVKSGDRQQHRAGTAAHNKWRLRNAAP